ncbi:putative transporter MCH1 [Meyerozyma sp. JA9]|nr:putative transporter MCH1 [Meyerozyma sp. JA9]
MAKLIARTAHRIRHYLSYHVSHRRLKVGSFVASLLCCLSAGSILLFSLFSYSLHSLGLSYLEINSIASVSAVGMYLCLPVLGYLADTHGPPLLSLISIFCFVPSYYYNAYLVQASASSSQRISVAALSMTFLLIGLATSALYFSSLLTCAKIFPNRKGLAISLPVTCYGLSSLIGSQVLQMGYFRPQNHLDLYRVFCFFGTFYLAMGLVNFLAASLESMESDVIFSDHEPLLHAHHDPEDCTDNESLRPVPSTLSQNQRRRFGAFLADPRAWLLLVSFVLAIGPLESFQNNLGSIVENSSKSQNLTTMVSILAACSTVSRLVAGGLCDWLHPANHESAGGALVVLPLTIIVAGLGQFLVNFANLKVATGVSGAGYGGLFTVYPTIIASIWGIDMLGTIWGSFMVGPAVGSVMFSLLYGHEADGYCPQRGCLRRYFGITTASMVLSLVLVAVMMVRKRKPGL